jgi:uncharacterized protein with HEPN domain
MPDDAALWLSHRLDHMRDAASQACLFVEGMIREDFIADPRTHQACSLNLIIIGEAAKRILDRHPEMKSLHPQIAWRQMAGMRNRIAHGYDEIDLNIVWDTIAKILPGLIDDISVILDQINHD